MIFIKYFIVLKEEPNLCWGAITMFHARRSLGAFTQSASWTLIPPFLVIWNRLKLRVDVFPLSLTPVWVLTLQGYPLPSTPTYLNKKKPHPPLPTPYILFISKGGILVLNMVLCGKAPKFNNTPSLDKLNSKILYKFRCKIR